MGWCVLLACSVNLSYDDIEAYHDQSHPLLGEDPYTEFRHRSTIVHMGTFDWIFAI
jgi:hypothetical protein